MMTIGMPYRRRGISRENSRENSREGWGSIGELHKCRIRGENWCWCGQLSGQGGV